MPPATLYSIPNRLWDVNYNLFPNCKKLKKAAPASRFFTRHDIMSAGNEQCHPIKMTYAVLAQGIWYFCWMIVRSTDIEENLWFSRCTAKQTFVFHALINEQMSCKAGRRARQRGFASLRLCKFVNINLRVYHFTTLFFRNEDSHEPESIKNPGIR